MTAPLLAVFAVWIAYLLGLRFYLGAKLDALDALDARMDAAFARVDARFDAIDAKFDALGARVDADRDRHAS